MDLIVLLTQILQLQWIRRTQERTKMKACLCLRNRLIGCSEGIHFQHSDHFSSALVVCRLIGRDTKTTIITELKKGLGNGKS